MKKPAFNYIISAKGNITLNIDGKPRIISKNHVNYDDIRDALKAADIDAALDLIDVERGLKIAFNNRDITIENGEIYFRGKVVKNVLVDKIIKFYRDGLPFEPLVRFFENLMLNPTEYAVNELYGFLEAKGFALTDDGCFLAYKRINSDWKDFYTDKMDNSIGTVVKMERKEVDADRNRTCSNGLHVCSEDYLPYYHNGQGRTVIVKVNPKDVVSIPADYNNTKMRCCEYVVLQEVASTSDLRSEDTPMAIGDVKNNDLYEVKDGTLKAVRKMPRRGPDGRFIKKQKPVRGPDGRFIKRT